MHSNWKLLVILDAYVGSKLRQLRLNRMVDPERMSRQLGIGHEVLAEYERGRRPIPTRLLFGLGDHESVSSLIVDTGDRVHRFTDVPSNGVVTIP